MNDPDTRTRVMRPHHPEVELAERIALFAVINRYGRAGAVLEGLAGSGAAAAKRLTEAATAWSSAKRQARATLEFGQRGDQHERLAALINEAPPLLRQAMHGQMTPHQQARFAHLARRDARPSPARTAFAARLVREACR